MTDVLASIGRVTGIMAGIAEASREQRSGIEQVNRQVAEFDVATRHNAALVEQVAASGAAQVVALPLGRPALPRSATVAGAGAAPAVRRAA